MKTKLYWLALLVTVALIGQTQAGGQHGGGGGGGHFASSGGAPARGGGGPAFQSMPGRSFGGNRMIYSGQRFSSVGMRSPRSMEFRPQQFHSNAGGSIGSGQFNRGNINRGDRLARFSNTGNRAITNPRREGTGAGQVRSGNGLPTNWRNHVAAQHSGNWHRDWDRSRDHVWQGHHCRFINGSWVIFDFGFDPWWPYWGYPYDYYGYNYYPDYYDQSGYGGEYYDQNGYGDQSTSSIVAAAQERLARDGYYRGQIDGIVGPETRRAIARYQSNHGLRVNGNLTPDTLGAMGLRQVASY
jgi:Putative peptidoglycan binding domain